MEKLGKLSYRYANALLSAIIKSIPPAELDGTLDRARIALSAFAEAWRTNKDFKGFLRNPLIALETRRTALDRSLTALSFPEQLQRFISIVFDRNRIEFLPDMSACFALLVDRRSRIIDVKVTSAFDLSDGEKTQISDKLRQRIEGSPRYHFKAIPEIIGGLIIEFDGKVLDGSLRARLTQMQKELAN